MSDQAGGRARGVRRRAARSIPRYAPPLTHCPRKTPPRARSRQALAALQRSTHVLTTVPPDGDSDPVLSAHARHLADSQGRLRWVGYISSTSVYGDHRGGWVDEGSELLAAHGRGLSRMMTETAWLQLHYEHGAPVHVLRCGGIYGPRRSALEAAQRGGAPSEAQARRGRHRYTARCHVLDICRVVEASMERPRPAAVYNLVDDDPAGREEVVAFAADLLARRMAAATQEAPAAAPRGEAARRAGRGGGGGGGRGAALDSDGSGDEDAAGNAADPAPAVAAAAAAVEEEAPTVRAGGSRRDAEGEGGAGYPDEKRVRNELIKAELGVALEFPTYREGIAALVAGDMRPF